MQSYEAVLDLKKENAKIPTLIFEKEKFFKECESLKLENSILKQELEKMI